MSVCECSFVPRNDRRKGMMVQPTFSLSTNTKAERRYKNFRAVGKEVGGEHQERSIQYPGCRIEKHTGD